MTRLVPVPANIPKPCRCANTTIAKGILKTLMIVFFHKTYLEALPAINELSVKPDRAVAEVKKININKNKLSSLIKPRAGDQ
jgi:hypothetical protein